MLLFDKVKKLIFKNSYSFSDFEKAFNEYFYGQSKTGMGINVNEETAMKLGVVSTCVGIISNDIGLLPLKIKKYRDPKNPAKGSDLAIEHPLYNIFKYRTNKYMTSFNFKEKIMSDLLLSGNSYCYKTFNRKGEVIDLMPLDWQWVGVKKDEETGEIYYTYQEYGKGEEKKILRDFIWHISGYGNGLIGKSPITIKRESIGIAMSSDEFATRFYKQGLNIGSVITMPGAIKDPESLRKELKEKYSGLINSHKPLVLEDGMKFEKVTMNLNDAEFIATRKFQAVDIASWYRVPIKMIGNSEFATYANYEQQSLDYVRQALLPWCIRLEKFIECFLLTDQNLADGYYAEFDLNILLKGDSKTLAEVNHLRRQDGIITTNEWRTSDGLNPREEEEADKLVINGNMRTIEIVNEVENKTSIPSNNDDPLNEGGE